MLKHGTGIPFAFLRVFNLLDELDYVPPGQLCNRLFHNWSV